MNALLRQSLANAGVLDALQGVICDRPPERNELHLKECRKQEQCIASGVDSVPRGTSYGRLRGASPGPAPHFSAGLSCCGAHAYQ
jgi:hypothetical protein